MLTFKNDRVTMRIEKSRTLSGEYMLGIYK